MKYCAKCGAQMDDSLTFCPNCGTPTGAAAAPAAATVINETDHTAEFDPKDISDNKVVAMLPYLSDFIGIVIAALIAKDSAYVSFHVRQALKLNVVSTLIGIISALLIWTFIVPIAGGICLAIITVLKIIAFFQVCGGKAKEPAIISNLKFLK